MKKIFLLITAVFLLASCEKKENSSKQDVSVEKKEPVYKFVNTYDGIKVRDKESGNRIAGLKCNERVEILEKGSAEVIEGFQDNWYKICTENGTTGYVYGAYLSDSLEDAEKFRFNEMRAKAWKWFESWEEKLSGEINIDTNPYHIKYYEEGEASSDFREFDGFDLHFLSTYNEENDKYGWFLEKAVFYNNGENFPAFLPVKIGDNIEKLYEVLGNKDMLSDIFLKVEHSDDGTINLITLGKTGW